jgi:hypothetical protein
MSFTALLICSGFLTIAETGGANCRGNLVLQTDSRWYFSTRPAPGITG